MGDLVMGLGGAAGVHLSGKGETSIGLQSAQN